MFDVGFTELILLAVIGLLVLGPERLPKVARTLGGLTRKARSSWLNLKRSIEAEIDAEELKKPVKKMQDDVRSAIDGIDQKMKKASETVSTAVSGEPAKPPSTKQPAADPASTIQSADKQSTNNDQH